MRECKAEQIVPHRSYRRLRINKPLFVAELLAYFLVSAGAVYLYGEKYLNLFTQYFKKTLLQAGITDIGSVQVDIFGFDITLLGLPFKHTQPLFLFFILVGMLALFFILRYQKIIAYNIAMWINFFLLVFMVFLLYFIFLPAHFPYTFFDYFDLYLTAQIGMMLFSFLILGVAIALTPAPVWLKAVTFLVSVPYYIVYSLLRYALTILLVSQFSIVFAPIMFFTLYLDFVFFVAVYSYFLYKSAVLFGKKETVWKW